MSEFSTLPLYDPWLPMCFIFHKFSSYIGIFLARLPCISDSVTFGEMSRRINSIVCGKSSIVKSLKPRAFPLNPLIAYTCLLRWYIIFGLRPYRTVFRYTLQLNYILKRIIHILIIFFYRKFWESSQKVYEKKTMIQFITCVASSNMAREKQFSSNVNSKHVHT